MRTMARTAVISSTAQASMNAVNRRQAQRNAAAYGQAEAAVQQQQAPAAAPAPTVVTPAAAPSMDDKLAQLERLSQLQAQGVLTPEEFAAQKAVILAG